MLRIPCPFCGLRDEDEFTYGGPWDRRRPADPQALSDEAWAVFLFERENPRGAALERWRHTFGCRQWIVVDRDTLSHRIARVMSIADAPERTPAVGRLETLGIEKVQA